MSKSARDQAIQMIYDGARLHYERDDDDSLLRGDQLYAQGLEALAELGDLEAVAKLAEVISRVAQGHAEGDPRRAAAAWEAAGLRLDRDGQRSVDGNLQ
ncbi:MAG: hypothetical protein JOZ73_07765 [Solirubrobacterales bacterium]|nr:hypothetical protein [Solirubrobacterales bacterium]